MMMPIISVCIPTYNNLSGFRRAIESLVHQSFQDFEVIVTDDSTNNDIVDYLAHQTFSFPIVYKRNIPSLGSPANWNKALALAKGEFIKILHHDDWLATDASLAMFMAAMDESGGKAFIFSNTINVYAGGKQQIRRPSGLFLKRLGKDPYLLFFGNYIGSPSVVFFSRKLGQIFDCQSRWYVDVIFYVAVLKANGHYFKHIDAALVKVTAGDPGQLTQRIAFAEKFKETMYMFNQYLPLGKQYRLLLLITLTEQLKEYGLKQVDPPLKAYLGIAEKAIWWSKIPLPFVFFSALRNLLLRYL
jgi:glycosyltransferase involved in cell wall biosynthesis